MPSVGSIFATLEKNYHQDKVACSTKKPGGLSHAFCQEASFPSIDPLDAFYLLNPGGDLGITQIEFEKWFRDQNLEVISWFLFFSFLLSHRRLCSIIGEF